MTEYKKYRRKQVAEIRPYKDGDDLNGVSISMSITMPVAQSGAICDFDGEYEFIVARHWIARETLANTALTAREVFFS